MPANALHISVQEPWFSHIRSRNKVHEGRLNRLAYAGIRCGDVIVIRRDPVQSMHDTLIARVTALNVYKSFRDMLTIIPISKVLPGISSIDEGVDIYNSFYPLSDQEAHKVLCITLEIVDDKYFIEPSSAGLVYTWLGSSTLFPV